MTEQSPYKTSRGYTFPLGVSKKKEGLNFALFSKDAQSITLCLFALGEKSPFLEIPLDSHIHKTGFIWHILISNLPSTEYEYGYKVDGKKDKGMLFDPHLILSDPYAKCLNSSNKWGKGAFLNKKEPPKGLVVLDEDFDWENTPFPLIPMQDLIIYEMHVRGFTKDTSSNAKHPATFEGVIEKIPYLKELGVNAVELLPVFEFNEMEYGMLHPETQNPLKNYWGYSTINFFSPMNRYAFSTEYAGAIKEFKKMVKELHKNGIEVILDVVYNHTAEGNIKGPVLSMKGIDNPVYYMTNEDGTYKDYTGCGNTLNCNHPIVAKLIVDSLKYWVEEMHVDGFRFDLASILTRNPQGAPLDHPPVIRAISTDPTLAQTKLIAEAWDAAGLYQVGSFPHYGKWGEWNGQYRDIVRSFIKGTESVAADFGKVLTGSEYLYGHGRAPYHSINFITAHDGFSIKDLVSYQGKHNLANGENNQDGANQNDSWNCGIEGVTNDPAILALRDRQIRNMQLALMVSMGTPMILMGDEYGHTRLGNNNTWCQDSELNWFLWDELKKNATLFRFYKLTVNWRKNNPIFKRTTFLKNEDIDWHGIVPFKPNWGPENRFLAYTLKDNDHGNHFYIAFNSHFEHINVEMPPASNGKHWARVIDTSIPSPNDFVENPENGQALPSHYTMPPHSAFVAKCL